MKFQGMIITLVVLLLPLQSLTAAEPMTVPVIQDRVTDHAGILSASQGHLVHQISSQHEFLTKQRIALVTIASCGGLTPQEYADKLHRHWDNKKRDKGALLVLYKQQRSAAIAIGEALKGKLDKDRLAQIVDGEVSSKMQAGSYDDAAMEGITALLGHLGESR